MKLKLKDARIPTYCGPVYIGDKVGYIWKRVDGSPALAFFVGSKTSLDFPASAAASKNLLDNLWGQREDT